MSDITRRLALVAALAALCLGSPAARSDGPGIDGRRDEDIRFRVADVLKDLETFVLDRMTAEKVPGLAYVVVQGDQVVYAKGFGVRKLGATDPVDTHTVFEIGSASKAFTATTLATVVEEGKLAWTDRVADHLQRVQMHDPWVTRELRVADLLCQRSGMPANALDSMSALGFSRDDIIQALRHVEPVSSFRSEYAYQNNLWLVAAALIESKTGLTWEDNLDRRIFGPLGMTETTTSPEVVATMANVATGHFRDGAGVLVPIPPDFPYRHWLETYGPAGSIRSTVLDLAQWVRLQINLGTVGGAKVLSNTGVAYLHAPKTLGVNRPPSSPSPNAEGDLFSYASGWLYQTSHRLPLVWHNGGTTGQHSIVGYIPEAGVGLAMLTNEPNNQVPEEALNKLAQLVLGLPSGALVAELDRAAPPSPRVPAVAVLGPSLPLDRYTGTYANPAYGPFEVRVKDGKLELVFGPKRFVGTLQPVSGNTFLMPWPGWETQTSTVTFTVPAGGPATKMNVSRFEDVRGGDFVRRTANASN